jgi:hypothetical protein
MRAQGKNLSADRPPSSHTSAGRYKIRPQFEMNLKLYA